MFIAKLRYLFTKITPAIIDDVVAKSRTRNDWMLAIWLCNRYLKRNPEAVLAVLVRARCYQALKMKSAYRQEVKLALALDDTFIPSIYHQASNCVEDGEIGAALSLLNLIKDHPSVKDGVDTLLASICMRQANTDLAKEYQLRSWMANFDSLRHANAYLFGLAYANITELEVAIEHKFWGATLQALPPLQEENEGEILARAYRKIGARATGPGPKSAARVRIGYWGGDFKEHSVRYFFRPLIEGHNRSKFEIFVYDENFMDAMPDHHTEAIRERCDRFYTVSTLSDEEVRTLISSHDLDVLVEIQGHTSANRLHLLQARYAKLQITGLAYPPTTGLSSIDYKLIDDSMLNNSSSLFYTERVLSLGSSFWCFDPKEEAPYTETPPFVKNGYFTIGCWGNPAKITTAMMHAWASILEQVPTARLSILSHTFGDDVSIFAFRKKMESNGVPLDRLICRPSVLRDDLWQEYKKVDIMFDTFPFNGGTTTCWATYAGVPVLSLSGMSLTSLMGKSVMTSLGFSEFIAYSLEDYIRKAVHILNNPDVIIEFRSVARKRFLSCALGNQNVFAAEFESACMALLSNRNVPAELTPSVPSLNLSEVLRRAKIAGYQGNIGAMERILQFARVEYGDCAEILDYEAEAQLARGNADYVLNQFKRSDYRFGWGFLNAAAIAHLVSGRQSELPTIFEKMRTVVLHSASGELSQPPVLRNMQLQLKLWEAWQSCVFASDAAFPSVECNPCLRRKRFFFVVIGQKESQINTCIKRIRSLILRVNHSELEVKFFPVLVEDRILFLNSLLEREFSEDDVVVIIRDNVEICCANFFNSISDSLDDADAVGFAGAIKWTQKDWALDHSAYKVWGAIRPSAIADSFFELHFAGVVSDVVVKNICVLDGQLIAFLPNRLKGHSLNDSLGVSGYWAEEDWINRAAVAGCTLVVHKALGVVVHLSEVAKSLHVAPGLGELLLRLNIDPLDIPVEDYTIQSIQVHSVDEGMAISQRFLRSET